jgi:5'-nucleotidase
MSTEVKNEHRGMKDKQRDMHILVTNDDGVRAPGLLALAGVMRQLGAVTVIAPHQNQSAIGHRKTMHKPLRAWQVRLADGTPAIASSGSPADAVALALLGLVAEPVHMVVSGINHGPNLSRDITYSGTVTAAMEGVIWNLPALAVSLDTFGEADYAGAAEAALRVARLVAEHGLPPLTLLNVNIPALPPEQIAGVRVTRQGRRVYQDKLVQRLDPRGQPYYWIGGKAPGGDYDEEGTDVCAVAHGYISVTPITMDMTNHEAIGALQKWEW